MSDWNPDKYSRFGDVRLQPALDLLARIGAVPEGDVVDLGCGNGAVGARLRDRFEGRVLVGVDNSEAMLEKAHVGGAYDALVTADIADWVPERAPAVIFSNAALQWLDGHDALLPQLTGMLRAGGILAVQMPAQNQAPSHAAWGEVFSTLFQGRDVARGPEILSAGAYFDLLATIGDVRVWEVLYYQYLAASEDGHPVRRFTESTFARPYLDAVTSAERLELIAGYEAAMAKAYPLRADGSVLFPFRRLFLTVEI
ncbi:methyltransferase domain-containing protein [Shimia abyssi]|uniref:Trans-aconitate 2-methyltransferase n=1 Tax=Shimia abyssi TaxID=1662395 RepID=A0A2P8FE10_9RHOB|nr:methyltransferase domain-containing protein [Shimia abyssi]PSL19962.1 trans-aconitate 2-methyltransferase [Shimia abyssi]